MLVDHASAVIFIEDTGDYSFVLFSPDTYVLGAKYFLMWLRSKLINFWGSPLVISGCWLHGPGGSCGGKEARTYQSRKARAQLHDGYSADEKSKSPSCIFKGNINVIFSNIRHYGFYFDF